jgi:hypothetical protein
MKLDRETLIQQMTDYVINVLEERRPEFSGLPVCPFVKPDRITNQLHFDVFDNSEDTLVDVVLRFVRSGKRSALIAQPNEEIDFAETKGYQKFINLVAKETAGKDIAALCFNPSTQMEIEGYNPYQDAPFFMINFAYVDDLSAARKKLLQTSYYDKMSDRYKKYLNIK